MNPCQKDTVSDDTVVCADKGQKSNREARKPKKEKVKTNASQPSQKSGAIRGLENMKNS